MNRSIPSLALALAFAVFGAGCAVQTSTDAQEADQAMVGRRAQLDDGNLQQARPATPAAGEQQVNLDLRPDSKVEGPVPDPWVGAGPVPDPWNPGGDPHHPKTRLVAVSNGADDTPSGTHK